MAEDAHLREEIEELLVVDELILVELIEPGQEDRHQHVLVLHMVLAEGQLNL